MKLIILCYFLFTCMYWYSVMHFSKIEMYIKESIMRYVSPSKFRKWMGFFLNINNCKMNISLNRNKYKIPSSECILFNEESTWLYQQSNIPLLQVGVKHVPGEISEIIQAKNGDVVYKNGQLQQEIINQLWPCWPWWLYLYNLFPRL